jgi:hypothetical protein
MTHMLWSARALAAVAMAAVLAACGQGAHKAGAGGQSQQNRDLSQGHKSGDTLDPDMVAAVSSAHSSTPISMKFRLAARPVVGSPLQVLVALIPAADVSISHIHAAFQPSDGLQLQGEHGFDVNGPDAGVVIEQELSVVPQQPGVLSLNATVVVDLDGGSLARSYSIPLIAGDNPSQPRSP